MSECKFKILFGVVCPWPATKRFFGQAMPSCQTHLVSLVWPMASLAWPTGLPFFCYTYFTPILITFLYFMATMQGPMTRDNYDLCKKSSKNKKIASFFFVEGWFSLSREKSPMKVLPAQQFSIFGIREGPGASRTEK